MIRPPGPSSTKASSYSDRCSASAPTQGQPGHGRAAPLSATSAAVLHRGGVADRYPIMDGVLKDHAGPERGRTTKTLLSAPGSSLRATLGPFRLMVVESIWADYELGWGSK